MTQHTISWDHAGNPQAKIDIEHIRASPVGVEVFMRIDGVGRSFAAVPSMFQDEAFGFGVAFGLVPTTGIGVHVRHRAINEDMREIVVSLSNCVTDRTTHRGGVYFSDLQIRLAAGWNHWTLDRPAVSADATQYMPVFGQLTRRYVAYRGANRQAAHDYLYLRSGAPVRSFGPSGISLLPDQSLSAGALVETIRAGSKSNGFFVPSLGVWHPYGDQKSYAHGGDDIFPSPRLGPVLWHQIRADATAERERAISLNTDGSPTQAHEWGMFEYIVSSRGNVFNARIPAFNGGTVNNEWTERKMNSGHCAYEPEIQTRIGEQGFAPHDMAHGCRRLLDALALYYRTGDTLSRMNVQLAVQDAMTSYRITKIGPEFPSYPGEYVPFSLHAALGQAKRYPHLGGRIQREMGWYYWHLGHGIAITPPGPARDRMIENGRVALDYATTVAMPNGCSYMGQKQYNSDEGEPWSEQAMREKGWSGRILNADEQEQPVFQTGILHAGLGELSIAVTGSTDSVAPILSGAAAYLYGDSSKFVPDAYRPDILRGCPWYAKTAQGQVPTATLDGIGLAHTIHSYDTLARAYRAQRDGKFLRMATSLTLAEEPGTPKQQMVAMFKDSPDPWHAYMRWAVTQ